MISLPHYTMIRSIAATLACALLATPLAAQSAGLPDDVQFDRVGPGADSLQVYMVDPGGQTRIGTVRDELRLIDRDGQPALLRIYVMRTGTYGIQTDSMVSRLPSLLAISHSSDGGGGVRAEFAGDSIRGVRGTAVSTSRFARATEGMVYDGAMFDVMVRSAPLAEGYTMTTRVYSAASNEILNLRATVAGSERVEVENGKRVDTWKVELDFAGMSSTLWITKDTRALARQIIRVTPNRSLLFTRAAPRK